jgi:hypothetical protein
VIIDKIMRLPQRVASRNRRQPQTDHAIAVPACPSFDGGLIWLPSGPTTGLPNKKDENRDQRDHDQHPVLALETEKRETLDEKLHRSCPHSCAG